MLRNEICFFPRSGHTVRGDTNIPLYNPTNADRDAILRLVILMNIQETGDEFQGMGFEAGNPRAVLVVNDNQPLSAVLTTYNPDREDPVPDDVLTPRFGEDGARAFQDEGVRRFYLASGLYDQEIQAWYRNGLQALAVIMSNQGQLPRGKIEKICGCDNGPADLDNDSIREIWGFVRPYYMCQHGAVRMARFVMQITPVLEDLAVPAIINELRYSQYRGETSVLLVAQAMMDFPNFPWAHIPPMQIQQALQFCTVEDGVRVVRCGVFG